MEMSKRIAWFVRLVLVEMPGMEATVKQLADEMARKLDIASDERYISFVEQVLDLGIRDGFVEQLPNGIFKVCIDSSPD